MESDQPQTGRRRVTVAEASAILGVSVEAVRGRIKRGTLEHERDSGTVYVLLDADQPPTGHQSDDDQSTDQAPPDERDKRIEDLREQVAYLQGVIATRDQELALRAEEIRRRDTALEREQELAAMFANRLRELEAPREQARSSGPSGARMSPETAPGGPGAAWDTWQEEPREPSERSEPRESPQSSGLSATPQPPDEEAHGAAERPSEATEEKEPEGAAVPHGGGGIHITIPHPGRWWRRILGR